MKSFVVIKLRSDLKLEGMLFELQEGFRSIASPPAKGNSEIR